MSPRERFVRQMRFERVDRPFHWETLAFWEETVERWWREGLPPGMRPEQYFQMEGIVYLPVNCGFTGLPYDPPFERVDLERTERTITYRNSSGIVLRQRIDHPSMSMPQWIKFPVETRADWERIRDERLDPDKPSRYPDWDEMHRRFDDRDFPLGLTLCGAYGTPRNCFGEEKLAYVYYDDPELIHEIMRWWLEFYTRVITNVTRNFPGLDFVLLWEDMAYKTGPLISPAFVRRFMYPYYEHLIAHINSCGIDVILLDTDGNAEVLVELFLEAGVNAMCPFEIAAGMEPLPIRKRYGHRLAMIGGIDKRAVAEGGEAMKKEVMRKVPPLLQDGGYIPCIDHATPPDTSFENHRAYVELVRELGEKYGG